MPPLIFSINPYDFIENSWIYQSPFLLFHMLLPLKSEHTISKAVRAWGSEGVVAVRRSKRWPVAVNWDYVGCERLWAVAVDWEGNGRA